MGLVSTRLLTVVSAMSLGAALPLTSQAAEPLQCVPYARVVSGIALRGDALNWWSQAASQYERGNSPRKGAIMAFRPFGPMTLGHLAVVSKVLNEREVLVRHANWSTPGAIEEDVLVRDVSDMGDWSAVKVWHSPTNQMGVRTNPLYGFIYAPRPRLANFVPERDAGGASYAYLNQAPRRDDNLAPDRRWAQADTQPNRAMLADIVQPYRAKYGVDRAVSPAPVAVAANRIDPGRVPFAPARAAAIRPAANRDVALADGQVRTSDGFIIEYVENLAAAQKRPARERTLADIVAEVKRSAKIG